MPKDDFDAPKPPPAAPRVPAQPPVRLNDGPVMTVGILGFGLSIPWLTGLYDPILRLTMREATFKSQLVAQADLRPGHRVLDLGCGTGLLATAIAARGPAVTGVDPAAAMLAIARDREGGGRVTWVHADGRSVRYAMPLAAAGWAIALYHCLVFWGLVTEALVPCGKGGSCADAEVQIVGFVPIPLLSVAAFTMILVLLWVSMKEVKT